MEAVVLIVHLLIAVSPGRRDPDAAQQRAAALASAAAAAAGGMMTARGTANLLTRTTADPGRGLHADQPGRWRSWPAGKNRPRSIIDQMPPQQSAPAEPPPAARSAGGAAAPGRSVAPPSVQVAREAADQPPLSFQA